MIFNMLKRSYLNWVFDEKKERSFDIVLMKLKQYFFLGNKRPYWITKPGFTK